MHPYFKNWTKIIQGKIYVSLEIANNILCRAARQSGITKSQIILQSCNPSNKTVKINIKKMQLTLDFHFW